jgi:hypothetical protein
MSTSIDAIDDVVNIDIEGLEALLKDIPISDRDEIFDNTNSQALNSKVEKDSMFLNHLAKDYKAKLIKLNEFQVLLLNAIFRGREHMRDRNNMLGEALYEVLYNSDCSTVEGLEKALDWWI